MALVGSKPVAGTETEAIRRLGRIQSGDSKGWDLSHTPSSRLTETNPAGLIAAVAVDGPPRLLPCPLRLPAELGREAGTGPEQA